MLADASDPWFYDAYVLLEDMGDAYQDLVDEVAAGLRRLPGTSNLN
ncbi:hypothetical protein NRB20_04950 [Nocardia sp. RB20]|uniref:Uncharacterized protein n=1 Tax=Nocardia macrotermitis TaxID=2585198 RepID=A0A7K0CVL2_9NOCA|nr:hypothetical protein [Nocardia macrotermitis]